MVTSRPVLLAVLVGAALGFTLQACMRFDPAMKTYCENPRNDAVPCSCADAGARGELVDCCINPGFRCDRGQPCCNGLSCLPGVDGGGLCLLPDAGSAPFDAGITCIVTGTGPVPCGQCLGAGNCATCGDFGSCGSELVCSAAHSDGGPGACKSAECFEWQPGQFMCGTRLDGGPTMRVEGNPFFTECFLPGSSPAVGGPPCCYERAPGTGVVAFCGGFGSTLCACDGGSCWMGVATNCPL